LSCPKVSAPSFLVLDVNLAGLNGLDLQKQVAADRSDMPIIFITGFGDVPTTVEAMKAGAVEFLTKPFSDDVLMSAIQHALGHSRSVLDQESKLQSLRNRYASLSRREREVMASVVRGLLNKQVGFELGISEITVKAHRGTVMRKMKAASRRPSNDGRDAPRRNLIERLNFRRGYRYLGTSRTRSLISPDCIVHSYCDAECRK
jgi:FixJ family two-component response regulator